jgi:hypothetical protein
MGKEWPSVDRETPFSKEFTDPFRLDSYPGSQPVKFDRAFIVPEELCADDVKARLKKIRSQKESF